MKHSLVLSLFFIKCLVRLFISSLCLEVNSFSAKLDLEFMMHLDEGINICRVTGTSNSAYLTAYDQLVD